MRAKKLTLFAALAVLSVLPATAEVTLDEIIEKHITSKGGIEAIKAIDTLRITAKMQMGPGQEAPITMESKRPDSLRVEFSMQGMKGIQAYDGETGWQVMPMMGMTSPQEITGGDLERLVDQADIDGPLVTFKERGDAAEYLGTEDLDGKAVHMVKITRKSGSETVYLLDPESYLEIGSRSKTTMSGMELDIEVTYGDYKAVAGVMLAHSVSSRAVGTPMNQVLTIESVEANVEIADERFKMPVEEAAETPAAPAEKTEGE